jgi:polyisoprenoid-binding protein YceI
MSPRSTTPILSLIIVALIAAACGAAASVDVSASPAPTTAAPSASTATALAWTVSSKSKATVRVREQLAALQLPSDAVLVATGAKGSFQLNADGTFAAGSQISCDLTSLTSDQSLRDSFVKQSVLSTRQFPTATFVPTKASGLTLPLPANGDFSFTLTGTLTIHGRDKIVTFDVKATRTGSDLTAAATLNPTVKFEDFGMSQPSSPGRVLSVVDEIHLVVDLIATGPAS